MRCPICGEQSYTTSVICHKHIAFEVDSEGNLLARTDMIKKNDYYWTSIRIPTIRRS